MACQVRDTLSLPCRESDGVGSARVRENLFARTFDEMFEKAWAFGRAMPPRPIPMVLSPGGLGFGYIPAGAGAGGGNGMEGGSPGSLSPAGKCDAKS